MKDLYGPPRDTELGLRRCAHIARKQLGLITREQAIAAGVSPAAIKSLCRRGHWHRSRRMVFTIGATAPSRRQSRLGACLSYGDGVYLSHLAAADEWGFEDCSNDSIHLVTTRSLKARDEDVTIHRTRDLPRHHVCSAGPLPITTPLRTLVDIAPALSADALQIAFEDVLRRKLVSPDALHRYVLSRTRQGVAGVPELRRLLADDRQRTQSALEVIVEQAVRAGRLPLPQRQYVLNDVSGAFVARFDFAYPHARLGIEAQSWRWHSGQQPWLRDLDRFNRIQATGWRVLFVTHKDVVADRDGVVALIRRELGGQLPGLAG